MLVIGLDIGTSKIAGSLVSYPEKRLINIISVDNSSQIPILNKWENTQDPEFIVNAVQNIVSQLKKDSPGKISAIGISGQMHGILYVDGKGRALSPLFTWQDNRASQKIGNENYSGIKKLLDETGYKIPSGYGIATHYYNIEHRNVPKDDYKIVSIGSYISMVLSGSSKVCIDPSEGSSLGFFNNTNSLFDTQAMGKVFNSTNFLPEVVPFYTISGNDSDGIPVFHSLGDNQASFLGATDGRQKCLNINIGTSGQISCLADDLDIERDEALELRPFPGSTLVVGASLSGGKTLTLVVELFHDVINKFGGNMSIGEVFSYVDGFEWPEIENPVVIEPYFLGTRKNPYQTGSINNINLSNLNVISLLWGFSDAIITELYTLFLDAGILEKLDFQEIIGSGNGVRKNEIIRKIIEKKFESPVTLPRIKEEACFGASLYAWNCINQ